MIKSMAVVALGVATFAGGCNCPNKHKDKDMDSSEPKQMSVSGKTANTSGNGVAKCTQDECCDKSAAKPH
jgi:hypothetical protein